VRLVDSHVHLDDTKFAERMMVIATGADRSAAAKAERPRPERHVRRLGEPRQAGARGIPQSYPRQGAPELRLVDSGVQRDDAKFAKRMIVIATGADRSAAAKAERPRPERHDRRRLGEPRQSGARGIPQSYPRQGARELSLVDSHVHLDDAKFAERMMVIATDADRSAHAQTDRHRRRIPQTYPRQAAPEVRQPT